MIQTDCECANAKLLLKKGNESHQNIFNRLAGNHLFTNSWKASLEAVERLFEVEILIFRYMVTATSVRS